MTQANGAGVGDGSDGRTEGHGGPRLRTDTYECDRCGACCENLILEVDHLDVLREPLIAERGRLLDGHGSIPLVDASWSLWGESHVCAFGRRDDDGKHSCTIYPTRPNMCVGFVAGGEQCQMARKSAGLPALEKTTVENTVLVQINQLFIES